MDCIARLMTAVAAAGTLLISQDGHAQNFFEQLFGAAPPSAERAPGGGYSNPARYGEVVTFQSGAVVTSRMRRSRAHGARPGSDPDRANRAAAQTAGTRSEGFCVRICDGYYFPLVRSKDLSAQQSCEYGCPSASVAVYEGSAVETARNLAGEAYASLPTAFSFLKKTTEKCSCNFPQHAQSFSLPAANNDPTLRAGDIVFGDHEAFVCQGSKLVALDRSSLPSSKIREKLQLMLAAGRPRPAADLQATNAPGSVRVVPQSSHAPAVQAKIADDEPVVARVTPISQSSEDASTDSVPTSK